MLRLCLQPRELNSHLVRYDRAWAGHTGRPTPFDLLSREIEIWAGMTGPGAVHTSHHWRSLSPCCALTAGPAGMTGPWASHTGLSVLHDFITKTIIFPI
jgi:hypothetical protein